MYKAEFAKMIESEVALIFFITQERQNKSIKREFNVVNESNSPQLCRYNENLRASFPDCILDTPVRENSLRYHRVPLTCSFLSNILLLAKGRGNILAENMRQKAKEWKEATTANKAMTLSARCKCSVSRCSCSALETRERFRAGNRTFSRKRRRQ